MRFVMFVFPTISDDGWTPTPEAGRAMTKYTGVLAKAGVLLASAGLHPPAEGVRVSFPAGKATATDGPFGEAREVVGGYWLIEVKSKDDAVEWARRAPCAGGPVIEVRQVLDIDEFSPHAFSPDAQATPGR